MKQIVIAPGTFELAVILSHGLSPQVERRLNQDANDRVWATIQHVWRGVVRGIDPQMRHWLRFGYYSIGEHVRDMLQ